jgi:hypothetical protein
MDHTVYEHIGNCQCSETCRTELLYCRYDGTIKVAAPTASKEHRVVMSTATTGKLLKFIGIWLSED